MCEENTRRYERGKASTNPFGKQPQLHKNQRTDQGRPGSDWGLLQIEWLGIKYTWSCDAAQMLSTDSEFQADAQLQRSITDALNMPWQDIINSETLDRRTLYAHLAYLAQIIEPLDEYDRSSTIAGLSSQPASQDGDFGSPRSSPPQRQDPRTPTQPTRSSPPSMFALLTPRPKRQAQSTVQEGNSQHPFSSPLSSPPAIAETPTSSLHQRVSKPRLTYSRKSLDTGTIEDEYVEGHPDEGRQGDDFEESPVDNPVNWSDSGVLHLPSRCSPEDALDQAAQGKRRGNLHSTLQSFSAINQESNLPRKKNIASYTAEYPSSESSPKKKSQLLWEDLDYEPSSSQTVLETPSKEYLNISRNQLQAEHKAEEDVQQAARTFLNELSNFLRDRCRDKREASHKQWDLDSNARPGLNNKSYMIDTYAIVSNADTTLTVIAIDKSSGKPRNREVRLLVECKPAKHRLTFDAIFGQEVAEMLSEVLRLRDYHRLDRYTVFLMSWHHLECYFSRMDVTEAYLAQLHDTSGLLNHERPYVRQSKKLSLRDDSERVEIGLISARMVIDMLAMYKQPRKLGIIRHLTT